MPRLFVAVDLPEAEKERLAALKCRIPGARWCPVEQLHLTLKFVGEVDDATFRAIRKALSRVRSEPFTLALRGVGHFPPGKRARVLWVGLAQNDLLLKLQQRVDAALAEAAIPPEGRPFSPHITLARLEDTPPAPVQEFEAQHAAFSCEPFPVREFYLYASVLRREGAVHTREATYELAAAPGHPSE